MDKETFLNKITAIGTCEDSAERNMLLTEISDEVSKVYDDFESNKQTIGTLNDQITKNNADLDKLREYNMNLFKRIDAQKTGAEQVQGITGIEQPDPNKKRKFEDLFK